MIKLFIFFISLIGISSCLEVSPGSCADFNVSVIQNADVAAYLGIWYGIKRYENVFEFGDCSMANYTLYNDTVVAVLNSEVILENNTINSNVGRAYLTDPESGEGKLSVEFPPSPITSPYWILDTDYTGYAVVWSCTDLTDSTKVEFLWILSRERNLTASQSAIIDQVLLRNGVGNGTFHITEQNEEICTRSSSSATSFMTKGVLFYLLTFVLGIIINKTL